MQMLFTMLVTIEVTTVFLTIVREAENSGKRTVVGTLIKVKDVKEPIAALNIDAHIVALFRTLSWTAQSRTRNMKVGEIGLGHPMQRKETNELTPC